MSPTKAEIKAAEELAQATAESGSYAAQESDDNSIDVSNPAYVGVSEEYRNHANDSDAPQISEDEDVAAMEEYAAAHEEEMRADISPATGHSVSDVHPSEATKGGSEDIVQQNRAIQKAAAAKAEADLRAAEQPSDVDADAENPLAQ